MDSFDNPIDVLGGVMMVKKRNGGEMERRASCPSPSSLYTFPTQSSGSIDASTGPVVFTWNAACLDPTITKVDLKLYAPELERPIVKVWTGIPASDGSYSTTLLPKWWNSTTSIHLQLTLSDSTNLGLSFLSSTVAGPVFEVTYPQEKLVTIGEGGETVAAAPADTGVVDPIYTTASILSSSDLNAGSVFAAVFFPIVILLAGIFIYVRWARAKQSKKRERWSKAIDNRMSIISTSWNPTSPDPRKSISSPSANNNRRTQVGSIYSTTTYDGGRPSHLRSPQQEEMSQTSNSSSFARPATSLFLAGTSGDQQRASSSRVSFAFVDTPGSSRVSFVEGSRGGRGVSQVGRPSISMYSTEGTKQRGRESEEEMVSPDQAVGPWVLGNEEEVEEELSSMAAVRMMNGSHNPSGSYSSLTTNSALRFPSPAHTLPNINNQTPSSPSFPTSPPNFSPDAMLRNYASGGGQTAGRRMTVLLSGGGGGSRPGENNPFRKSMAGDVGGEESGGYGQAR